MRAFHPGCRFGFASFSSRSTHHHHLPPSAGDAQTVHLSCWALTWVFLKSFRAASCTTTFRWRYVWQLTVAGHTKTYRLLLSPKTSVGSISAHGIASGSLASSAKIAEDAGAPSGSAFRPSFILPIAHYRRIHFRPFSSFVGPLFSQRPLFSQNRHRSIAAAGNCGQLFRLRFLSPAPVATLPISSIPPTAARTPRPELRGQLCFVVN